MGLSIAISVQKRNSSWIFRTSQYRGDSDPIRKDDHWEELPEYNDEALVRMCQTENHLDELQQEVKISDLEHNQN